MTISDIPTKWLLVSHLTVKIKCGKSVIQLKYIVISKLNRTCVLSDTAVNDITDHLHYSVLYYLSSYIIEWIRMEYYILNMSDKQTMLQLDMYIYVSRRAIINHKLFSSSLHLIRHLHPFVLWSEVNSLPVHVYRRNIYLKVHNSVDID